MTNNRKPTHSSAQQKVETAEEWLKANERAIAEYNKRVDSQGMYNDGIRRV